MKKFALIAVATLFSLFFIAPATQAVDVFKVSEAGNVALKDVARCVESRDQLNVLYLMDASLSLKKSDPNGERAKILSQSIAGLVSISRFKEVNFSLVTFGDKFTTKRDWKKVDETSASTEQKWVETNVPNLNTESGTNWLIGLERSKAVLDNSPNSQSSCKLMIWITDGGIDLDSQARDTQALQTICGLNPKTGIGDPKNSVVDDLRSSGIYLFGVLLNNPKAIPSGDQATQRSKMSFMQAIAESSGTVDATWFGGSSSQFFNCGTSPIPKNYAPGAFFEAKDPIEVLRAMMRITTSLKGCASWGISEDGTFEVDKSVASVEASLISDRWKLISPESEVVADESSSTNSQSGIGVDVVGLFSNISIAKPVLIPGQWQVETNPRLPIEPYYCHGLRVNLNSISLVAGEEAEITGKISRKDGSRFDLDNYGSYDLSVTALDPKTKVGSPLKMSVKKNGSFSGKFTPKFDSEIVTFDIALDVTNSKKKAFLPLIHRFEMKIRDVKDYPHFEPAEVTLPDLRGRDSSTTGEVTIISASEPGQVCFKKPVIDEVPDGVVASDYSLSGNATGCIDVPANSKPIKVPVELKNTRAIDGEIQVLLPATLTTSQDAEGIPQNVTLKTNSVRGTSAPIWLVILLFLLSLAIPFGILTLINSRAARLSTKGLRIASVDVVVQSNGSNISLSRSSAFNQGAAGSYAGSLFQVTDWELVPFSAHGAKRWLAPNGATLVARRPSNPFGVVEGVVVPSPGTRAITGIQLSEDAKLAPIALNPTNQWVLQVPVVPAGPGQTSIQGQLIAFLDSSADIETDATRLSSEISSSQSVQKLSALFVAQSQTGNTNPFVGGESNPFGAPSVTPSSPPPQVAPTNNPPAAPPQAPPQANNSDSDDPFKGL